MADYMNIARCRAAAHWYAETTGDPDVRRIAASFPVVGLRIANRQLGRVQGWLAANGVFSWPELDAHIEERPWEMKEKSKDGGGQCDG